jgi:hypothetical protein
MTRIPVPVACTLEPGAAVDRVGEWQSFLADRIDAVEHTGPAARLRLRAGDDILLAAVDLAQREKACCGFFRFAVELEADCRWLRIEVPPDAAGVLDQFLAGHPSEKGLAGRQ